MRKSIYLGAVLYCMAFAAAPGAFASGISSLTLTPSGSQMDFTIAGVYTPGTPTTAFSSPGTSYTLTFTLPASPTSFLEQIPGVDFGVAATVDINGVTFANSEILFFTDASSGGLAVCVGEVCPPTSFSPIAWNITELNGAQLFTSNPPGGILNPTFIAGAAPIDLQFSDYQIITPEPSSLLLLGTGLAGFAAWGRRKFLA